MNRQSIPVVVFLAAVLTPGLSPAQSPRRGPIAQTAQDLKRLSIEELADLDVTTATRRVERLSQIAVAVTVIRQEDIRRSGATTLAEAMRLADALHVAQVYGPGWSIAARGFNISTTNKMLVLIDGRTVYSPLFSGVFWEVHDFPLGDVDRIEVIRGPGGALWGANAVNGVINIITKRAADTQGNLILLAAGTEARGIATARHGGRVGTGGSYRVYGQFRAEDAHVFATGASGNDEYLNGQTGFRIESDDTQPSFWMAQGDAYRASSGLYDRPDTRLAGGNLLSRWTRRWSSTSEFRAQAYYDRTFRRVQRQFKATNDTFDLDMQQQLLVARRHTLVFGGGIRVWRGDDLGDGPGFFFEPEVRTSTLASVFAQDEIDLVPERLSLTLGSKLERNDFTGVEIQPTVRLRWTPDGRQTVWSAISRAVRMPTRFDSDLRILVPGTSIVALRGGDDFKSENVIAYEAGYRARPSDRIAFDIAAYTNRYDDLRSQEVPATVIPIVLGNGLNAKSAGVEVAATVNVTSWWQSHASYAYLWKEFSRDPLSRDTTGGSSEANDPSHILSWRSYVDLPSNLQFDAFVRYVGELPKPVTPAYAEATLRLGWDIRPGWELSIVGQNLLHDNHVEFVAGTPREHFERGLFVRSVWNF
jgi:iron complex outermembrane receptor protein